MLLPLIAIALLLASGALAAPAVAQVPHDQSDARVFSKGSASVQVSTYADDAKNLFVLIHASDKRAGVASLTIKSGNKVLKSCAATAVDVTGLACQYTWPRASMATTADYTIAVALKSGVRYEVYGKWARPELTVP